MGFIFHFFSFIVLSIFCIRFFSHDSLSIQTTIKIAAIIYCLIIANNRTNLVIEISKIRFGELNLSCLSFYSILELEQQPSDASEPRLNLQMKTPSYLHQNAS